MHIARATGCDAGGIPAGIEVGFAPTSMVKPSAITVGKDFALGRNPLQHEDPCGGHRAAPLRCMESRRRKGLGTQQLA